MSGTEFCGSVILAGGFSRRAGRDKALIEIDGETYLNRLCRVAAELSDEIVIVAPLDRGYQPTHAARIILDLWPGEGPLGGIITGLEALESGWAAILAVDMPLVKSDHLMHLRQNVGDGRVAVYRTDRLNPLCGVYHTDVAADLRRAFEAGERSVWRALGTVAVMEVLVQSSELERALEPLNR